VKTLQDGPESVKEILWSEGLMRLPTATTIE